MKPSSSSSTVRVASAARRRKISSSSWCGNNNSSRVQAVGSTAGGVANSNDAVVAACCCNKREIRSEPSESSSAVAAAAAVVISSSQDELDDDGELETTPCSGDTVDEEEGEGEDAAEEPMPDQYCAPSIVAPSVYIRESPVEHVWVCTSPFPYRAPTIAFSPADRPYVGDPQRKNPNAYVTPNELRSPPTGQHGKRKRIGRKNKFAALKFLMFDDAVHFGAVMWTFANAGFDVTTDQDTAWSIWWARRLEREEFKLIQPFQKVNHFPGTWGIARKDNLHMRMKEMQRKFGKENFGFVPDGFLLPQDMKALKLDRAAKAHCPPGTKRNLYIIKPFASACGRGIQLLCKGAAPRGKWLVQKYIHDPLLLHGYKFDLRLYVIVTSYDPLKIWVYDEGLVRIASSPYPKPGVTSKTMRVKRNTAHLTNYSVNSMNDSEFQSPTDIAGEEECASKWTFATVASYFSRNGLDWEKAWNDIIQVVIKTVISVEGEVVNHLRSIFPRTTAVQNLFELYGFDVMLREDVSPVLLEVNVMPSLNTACSLLDQRVKANMIADMLTLVGVVAPGRKHCKQPANLGHPFLNGLRKDDLDMVATADEELQRCGNFQRVFPTELSFARYSKFLAEPRSKIALLLAWESVKASLNVSLWTQHTDPKLSAVTASATGSAPTTDDEPEE